MSQKTLSKPPKAIDINDYARMYPDVGLSNIDPAAHYKRFAKLLGRVGTLPQHATQAPVPFTAAADTSPAALDVFYASGMYAPTTPIKHTALVSIVLPSYNNEQWLLRALHSALSQQGVQFEVIVVDDGSTDGSVRLARRLALQDDRLKVISLLRNFGCYYARNIGVQQAKGDYITILDSDDIMAPDRLLHQLDALTAQPKAVACHCWQRRWTVDYTTPLSEQKFGENSLLWKRSLLKELGYYDSVQFSGDAEFRLRIQRTFKLDSVIRLEKELYYLRTLDVSLTTRRGSQVFAQINGQLVVDISPPRQAYRDHFTDWQKANREPGSKYIPFPMLERPFPLGGDSQNASPFLGQRRVGVMASYPPRLKALQKVLPLILPQLDELVLYLNDYTDVPKCADDPKITVVLGPEAAGDLRDNGKFYALPTDGQSYIISLDDDIDYPQDYVARMIQQIEMLGRQCVVGVHGVIFPQGPFKALTDRKVYTYFKAYDGHFVDLLGTGTTAWHNSTFQPRLEDFKTTGLCDMWFARQAALYNVPLYAMQREKDWIKPIERFDESLYNETIDNPKGYFDLYNTHIKDVIAGGRVRKHYQRHLERSYDADALAGAGIDLDPKALIKDAKDQADDLLTFEIVINGWNCRDDFANCLRSIAGQRPGRYRFNVTLVDDGSDDGTHDALLARTILPGSDLIRIADNTGPAHARHVGITKITDPEAIVVLVDMDDALESDALETISEIYHNDPKVLMTIGNWQDQDGNLNAQDFYTKDEIDTQAVRRVEKFNATHLRTFRRKLYDAITPADLKDAQGKWLETCTDVALMYPLMDQCWFEEIAFVKQPLYRYTRHHVQGTLARFGKPHKVERLKWLKAMPPKPRLHAVRPTG